MRSGGDALVQQPAARHAFAGHGRPFVILGFSEDARRGDIVAGQRGIGRRAAVSLWWLFTIEGVAGV